MSDQSTTELPAPDLGWEPESELLSSLDRGVPGILASQKENGQFGKEPWICTDQSVLLALAAAWSLEGSAHHHSDAVLEAILRGGEALLDDQDEEGKWTFRKKDHSTWGQTLMPWVYSRWIRAYRLVREAIPSAVRQRWEAGLELGYTGIAATAMGRIHNIATHHAMGLYCAGLVFDRQDWRDQASAFMARVVAAQSPNGWWAEHAGPVVTYNFVYSESLGIYYALSRDESVLPALERAAAYHANLTYPDGSPVETVDGRNPYHAGRRLGNPGFSHTPAGRGYLLEQHGQHIAAGAQFAPDYSANMLLYSGSGPAESTAAAQERHVWRMGEEALVQRRKPWFLCVSAFTAPIPDNRWGQDRQNFVSLYHDDLGLVLGGGNTKLQPLWSNFTVGDPSLLFHTPGDEEPDFSAREGLIHVPGRAEYIDGEEAAGAILWYSDRECRLEVQPVSDGEVDVLLSATGAWDQPVEGHLTLVPRLGQELVHSSGQAVTLGESAVEWEGGEGAWIEHGGWRLALPAGTRLVWPALPHNPYRKAGDATVEEGRLVVCVPLSEACPQVALRLEVT